MRASWVPRRDSGDALDRNHGGRSVGPISDATVGVAMVAGEGVYANDITRAQGAPSAEAKHGAAAAYKRPPTASRAPEQMRGAAREFRGTARHGRAPAECSFPDDGCRRC